MTVEQANGGPHPWPFATGAARLEITGVFDDATVVTELAEFQRKGFKLWAINESLGIKTEIKKLRVNARSFLPVRRPRRKTHLIRSGHSHGVGDAHGTSHRCRH